MKPVESRIESRVTAQGQVSVPAEVRRRLGLTAGTLVEWRLRGSIVVFRRARRFTSEDIHKAVFPEGPPTQQPLSAYRRGIRARTRGRHAGH